jgi:hypothetical protein
MKDEWEISVDPSTGRDFSFSFVGLRLGDELCIDRYWALMSRVDWRGRVCSLLPVIDIDHIVTCTSKGVDQLSSRTNPDSSFGCFRQGTSSPFKRASPIKNGRNKSYLMHDPFELSIALTITKYLAA